MSTNVNKIKNGKLKSKKIFFIFIVLVIAAYIVVGALFHQDTDSMLNKAEYHAQEIANDAEYKAKDLENRIKYQADEKSKAEYKAKGVANEAEHKAKELKNKAEYQADKVSDKAVEYYDKTKDNVKNAIDKY
jgi:uncharacterized membrane protein